MYVMPQLLPVLQSSLYRGQGDGDRFRFRYFYCDLEHQYLMDQYQIFFHGPKQQQNVYQLEKDFFQKRISFNYIYQIKEHFYIYPCDIFYQKESIRPQK